MLKEYKVFGDLHNPEFEDTEKIYKQIETVLTELKRLQEETIEKDKIREKIEQLNVNRDMISGGYAISILEELLESK